MNMFESEDGKNWLKDLLRQYIITIYFKKSDGTVRRLVCTLNQNFLPNREESEGVTKTKKAKSGTSQAVFDVEKGEWRSFAWDTVVKISFYVD